MSGRGRTISFRPRRGFGSRGRDGFSDRSSNFSSSGRYDSMSRRSRDYSSSYDGHKPEMDMTKALVTSVLRGESHRGSRSTGYKHHSRSYQSNEFEQDRKKYYKDSDRSMRDHRTSHSESRRYSKEHRDEHFSRPSVISKDSHKYLEQKRNYDDHDDDDDGYLEHSMKRQRLSGEGSFRGSKFSMNRDPKFSMGRDSKFIQRESRSQFKPYQRFPSKPYFPRGRGQHKPEYQRYPIKASGRLKFNNERMLPFGRERGGGRDERSVNLTANRRRADAPYHRHGGEHVQLKCPHCPDYEAATFKEYRFHLYTPNHTHNLDKLIRKHSVVLRKIRLQQRDEQWNIEAAMSKENPEKFRENQKEFCSVCKLYFRIFNSESQEEHNQCRFHKMQVQYLTPYCKLCKMRLPSLMVYENHTASIRHLRSICEKKMLKKQISDEGDVEHNLRDDYEEFDMSNFVTMDAVGEDDTASMSDNEEITGKFEDVEEAMKETKADYDDDSLVNSNAHSDSDLKNSPIHDINFDNCSPHPESIADSPTPCPEDNDCKETEIADEEPPHGDKTEDLCLLVEDYHSDDENNLANESLGTEFLCEIEAMLCRLCGVAVRMDFLGDAALDKHCRSLDHISRFHEYNAQKATEKKIQSSDNDVIENEEKEDCSTNDDAKMSCQSSDEETL